MKKKIFCLVPLLLLCTAQAFGSGYRIPEQSLNSTALAAAYVANATGADSNYFNPANMAWLDDGWYLEGDLTYINLTRVTYSDERAATMDGDSTIENFFLPQFHLVSPAVRNFRFGLSLIYPAGLSKRWGEPFPKTFAEDFTLKVYELNPTISYKVCDYFSLALGGRILHSKGEVRSSGTITAIEQGDLGLGLPPTDVQTDISRNLKGDATEFGYNLAVTVKPCKQFSMAATYRSRVDLDLEGDADLTATAGVLTSGLPFPLLAAGAYDGDGRVSVPVPAVLTVGAAFTFNKTTVELVYDRTYWSAYDKLDFNYDTDLGNHPVLVPAFDDVIHKDWQNSDAYRIGVTHHYNDLLTLMAGFAIDRTPVPEKTLGFELPDSDALLYSLGFRYKCSEHLEIGAAYLYDKKEDRRVENDTLDGTFRDSSAHMVTLAFQYRF